jgi:hypothetical protein
MAGLTMIIINLLALLTMVAAGAVVGVLLTVRHYGHIEAERQAEEDRLAEMEELYAAWATIRKHPPGGQGPSAFASRGRHTF